MFNFLYLLLLLITALFFGKLAERLHVPTIVGNIFGGLLFGPILIMALKSFDALAHLTIFDDVTRDLDPGSVGDGLSFLIEFSIVMLMFASGLETRIKDFLHSFKNGIWTASLGALVPFVLGFIGVYLYLGDPLVALYVGGALSITAVALSVATLIQMDAIRSRFGMTIVNAAIVDDIIGIVILSILLSISKTGGLPDPLMVGSTIVLAVVFVLVSLFLMPRVTKIIYRKAGDMSVTEGVGFTILMAGIFGTIAHFMGLHLMIGAFLGGMTIRESLNPRIQTALKRWSFGFFAPVFFAWVGFSVTFSGVAISPLVPLLAILGMTGKVLGAGLGARISGLSWAESTLVGVGMNGRAAVDLILASVALGSGIIGRDLYSAVVINAVLMSLITPSLLKYLSNRFHQKGWISWQHM